MPIRGENVGTAYVRIIADGSDVPDGIREAMEDATPAMQQVGEEHSEAYQKGFNKSNEKMSDEAIEKMRLRLSKRAGRFDAVGQKIADNLLGPLREEMRDRFGAEIGDRLAADLEAGFVRRNGNMQFIRSFMDDLAGNVERAVKAIQADEKKFMRDREEAYEENARRIAATQRALEEEVRDLLRETDRVAREAATESAEIERRRHREHMDMLGEAYRMNQQYDNRRRRGLLSLRDDYRLLLEQIEDVEKGIRGVDYRSSEAYGTLRRMRQQLEGLGGDDTLSAEFERIERRVDNLHPRMTRMNRVFDDFSDTLGRATGRGSRNNFLNLIGSMTRGVSRLVFLVPRLAMRVGTEFAQAFQKAGGGMSGVVAGLGAMGPLLASGAIGVGVFAAALAGLVLIIAPLVSLLSMLTGIIAALAGTIAYALMGALGAVAGAFVPIVAGAGVLALALTNLSDKMKNDLKDATRGLRKDFTDLGRDAARTLTGDLIVAARKVRPVIEAIRPAVLGIADALGDVAVGWAEAMASDGFREWSRQMGEFLPNQVRRLGQIAENTFAGIGGLIAGMRPITRRFLRWLEDITEEFSQWANSKEGRQEIKEFFDDAAESAKSLGGFLEQVWGLLTDIFEEGRGTGDNIFDDMADAIERFRENINDGDMQQWFEDAEETANAIGRLLETIGRIIDILDSSPARDFLNVMLSLANISLTVLAGTLERVGEALSRINQYRDLSINVVAPGLGSLVQRFGALPGLILKAIGKVSLRGIFTYPALGMMAARFSGLGGTILKVIGRVQLLRAFNFPSIGTIAGRFSGLGAAILKALGKVALLKAFDFPRFGEITSRFVGLAAAILTALGKVRLLQAFEFPSWGDITSRFAGLGSAILRAIGSIVIRPSISMPDIPGVPFLASGGIVGNGGRLAVIGEDGPEAVVPLNRPLSQVDPAVRMLSAIAQGMIPVNATPPSAGKSVDASGWTIVTPGTDARAVAQEMLDRLAVQSY